MKNGQIALLLLLGGLAACGAAPPPGAFEPHAYGDPVNHGAALVPGERAPAESQRVALQLSQMDAVTAGLAGVDVSALALAIGPETLTTADAHTHVISNELFDLAFGVGSTLAVGEAAGIDVSTKVFGDGGMVIGTSYDLAFDLAGLSRGGTGGFVATVDPAHPRRRALEMRARALTRFLDAHARSLERRVALQKRALEFLPDRDLGRVNQVVDEGLARLNRRLAEGIQPLLTQGAQIDTRSAPRFDRPGRREDESRGGGS